MNLGEWPTSVPVRVRDVRLAPEQALRLGELGLRPGADVTVLQRAAFGGRVLALGAARLGVDRATCARIEVEA